MCLIVDVNVAARVLIDSADAKYDKLHSAIFEGRNDVVLQFGGLLRKELMRNGVVRELMNVLVQSGRARLVPDEAVNEEQKRIDRMGVCVSNDSHVVALAVVGGARLLATEDADLMQDFKNRSILGVGRGKIYARSSHATLVRSHCR